MKAFLKAVFSPKNEQSFGRVSAGLALVFGLAWITRLMLLISGPEHFEKLVSVGLFIGAVTGMVATLYGLSKGLDVMRDIKAGKIPAGAEEIKLPDEAAK